MPISLHPQLQQFITLLVLFVLGKFFAHIYPSWIMVFAVFLVATLVEHIIIYNQKKQLRFFSFSPLSTSLGVLLMLSSVRWWIYPLVVGLALVQKHFLSIGKYHFFNPSNFALIVAMGLFYDQTHIILGQLGDQLWLRIFVVIVAIAVLVRVDRWMIPAVFVATYLAFEYIFAVQYDPVLVFEMVYERFYLVSFVVFVAFMLTDPRTTPPIKWQQAIFALVISMIATYLDRIHGFRVQHLFMSLFVTSVWIPVLSVKSKNRKKAFLWSSILFILATGVIIFIENQPPYYFEMEG